MRLLPSGSSSLLVELDDLDAVLALYAALSADRLNGVIDLVPAAQTLLVVTDPSATSLGAIAAAVRTTKPRYDELPFLLDCDADEVVRRHREHEWRVAFCGFAPGFGYLTSSAWNWNVPRRSSPRTKVPTGSIALAGEFSGVYPRESPGGWQLIGRTDLAVFDLSREPAALLRPGNRVRFVEVAR